MHKCWNTVILERPTWEQLEQFFESQVIEREGVADYFNVSDGFC